MSERRLTLISGWLTARDGNPDQRFMFLAMRTTHNVFMRIFVFVFEAATAAGSRRPMKRRPPQKNRLIQQLQYYRMY
jgi:hypothetical protein